VQRNLFGENGNGSPISNCLKKWETAALGIIIACSPVYQTLAWGYGLALDHRSI